jgi:hypothetical protein
MSLLHPGEIIENLTPLGDWRGYRLETKTFLRSNVGPFRWDPFRPYDTKMPHFRCYLLNSADKIVSVDSFEAQSDAAAMKLAGQLILVKLVLKLGDALHQVGREQVSAAALAKRYRLAS